MRYLHHKVSCSCDLDLPLSYSCPFLSLLILFGISLQKMLLFVSTSLTSWRDRQNKHLKTKHLLHQCHPFCEITLLTLQNTIIPFLYTQKQNWFQTIIVALNMQVNTSNAIFYYVIASGYAKVMLTVWKINWQQCFIMFILKENKVVVYTINYVGSRKA